MPIERKKNDVQCKYLGYITVEKPTGMNILGPAIEEIRMTTPEDNRIPVIVKISSTSILVCSDDVCQAFFNKKSFQSISFKSTEFKRRIT